MITSDLRRALARAAAGAGLPPADPGLRRTGTPGQYASSVALSRGPTAARALADQLKATPWIAVAEVTGPGYLTVTVTPAALAAVAARVTAAGPGAAASDALRGQAVPAPPPGDPLAAATWEQARAALAAQLAARLAAAAGADYLPGERPRSYLPGERPPVPRSGRARWQKAPSYRARPDPPFPGERPPVPPDAGLIAKTAIVSGPPTSTGARRGSEPTGTPPAPAPPTASGPAPALAPPHPPPDGCDTEPPMTGLVSHSSGRSQGTQIADAVAFAGRDAVTFTLARAVPGKPLRVDPAVIARHVPANPAYAVRYAHARAAAGLRWGENSLTGRPLAPGRAAELAPQLLDALSWLPERVARAARRGRPDEFARYLEELAGITLDVLCSPGNDRLVLASAARTGLAAGLQLLGVSAPACL